MYSDLYLAMVAPAYFSLSDAQGKEVGLYRAISNYNMVSRPGVIRSLVSNEVIPIPLSRDQIENLILAKELTLFRSPIADCNNDLAYYIVDRLLAGVNFLKIRQDFKNAIFKASQACLACGAYIKYLSSSNIPEVRVLLNKYSKNVGVSVEISPFENKLLLRLNKEALHSIHSQVKNKTPSDFKFLLQEMEQSLRHDGYDVVVF